MEMESVRMRWVYSLMTVLVVALCTSTTMGNSNLYTRPLKSGTDIPLEDPRLQAPIRVNNASQVHITQGDFDGRAIIVTWVVPKQLPSDHKCWWGNGSLTHLKSVKSVFTQYTFAGYQSGFIYSCNITHLEYNETYAYVIDYHLKPKKFEVFSFKTPPAIHPDASYKFGLIGDLGQTEDSYNTLKHYNESQLGQTVLYVGDLSYADQYPNYNQNRWDSWTQMIEYIAAHQPWIWTAGNHEIEYLPDQGESQTFKSFTNRFPTPYKASHSPSPRFYSFQRASAQIIVLSSYDPFGKYSAQLKWLKYTLQNTVMGKMNRLRTPWLIVLMHCPWYNTKEDHYNEGVCMRDALEGLFMDYGVDIVFSGHVHSYERFLPLKTVKKAYPNGTLWYGIKQDQSAPIHIVIGDGGNIEGPSVDDPKSPGDWPDGNPATYPPTYSAYRNSSFGYGLLELHNRHKASWTWYKNDDKGLRHSDSVDFCNKFWKCQKPETTK